MNNIHNVLRPIIASIFILCIGFAHGAAKHESHGFIDANIYPVLSDIDKDSVITINTAAAITDRLSYFSLMNFINQDNSDPLSEIDAFYTEQNLRWKVADDSVFDLTLQMNFRTGDDNDRHRLGVRWRVSDTQALKSFFNQLHMKYSVNWHAVQFDNEPGHVWQLEHVLFMKFPYISNRLYLSAFADQTFNQDLASSMPSTPFVAEAQLGFELVKNFYVVTEYRLNQYRRSDVNNVAVGLQYKYQW